MTSRDAILNAVRKNLPDSSPLPTIPSPEQEGPDPVEKFTRVLETIGGKVISVRTWDGIKESVSSLFPTGARCLNLIPELDIDGGTVIGQDPHTFENVHVAILRGHFGVAENGAVWITEANMGDRALPFICEHLVLVIHAADIYPTLPQAYEAIGSNNYGFGTFIAGPSKTADIEQSLVLGAHGPKSLTLFLLASG